MGGFTNNVKLCSSEPHENKFTSKFLGTLDKSLEGVEIGLRNTFDGETPITYSLDIIKPGHVVETGIRMEGDKAILEDE